MISNPDWTSPKEKPYMHLISFECLGKQVDVVKIFNSGEIDCDACFEIQKQILRVEIEDPEFLEFAIDNFSELIGLLFKKYLTSLCPLPAPDIGIPNFPFKSSCPIK